MDGCMYFVRGTKHGEHLLVSFWSLRQNWLGPIQIVSADNAGDELAKACQDWDPMQATIIGSIEPDKHARGGTYASKSKLPSVSVFDRTIYLDADTLVRGDISPLLPEANRKNPITGEHENEIVLTQFADWTTAGRKMAGRISKWAAVAPEEVAHARSKAFPAINTGVMGWSGKGGEFAKRWREMTLRNVGWICDETATQLVFSRVPHRVLDDRFNASPIYSGQPTLSDAKVIHGHGQKFFKSERGWAIFEPALEEARAAMPCLQDWLAVRTPMTNGLLAARLNVVK